MTNSNEMREMAIGKMLEAVEGVMTDAKKTESRCLKQIEYLANNGNLSSSDITNAADDLKAARAVQQAIGEIAMWAQIVKQS